MIFSKIKKLGFLIKEPSKWHLIKYLLSYKNKHIYLFILTSKICTFTLKKGLFNIKNIRDGLRPNI